MITPLTRVILKAFLAAVCTLDESLPDAVQEEIRTVAQKGDYDQLDEIASNCPQLEPTYFDALLALNHPSQERNKGRDFRADKTPDPFNTEKDNFARKTAGLKDMQELLDKIEAEMSRNNANGSEVPEKIKQILTEEDSVAIARQVFA